MNNFNKIVTEILFETFTLSEACQLLPLKKEFGSNTKPAKARENDPALW